MTTFFLRIFVAFICLYMPGNTAAVKILDLEAEEATSAIAAGKYQSPITILSQDNTVETIAGLTIRLTDEGLSVNHCTVPFSMWSELRERYASKNTVDLDETTTYTPDRLQNAVLYSLGENANFVSVSTELCANTPIIRVLNLIPRTTGEPFLVAEWDQALSDGNGQCELKVFNVAAVGLYLNLEQFAGSLLPLDQWSLALVRGLGETRRLLSEKANYRIVGEQLETFLAKFSEVPDDNTLSLYKAPEEQSGAVQACEMTLNKSGLQCKWFSMLGASFNKMSTKAIVAMHEDDQIYEGLKFNLANQFGQYTGETNTLQFSFKDGERAADIILNGLTFVPTSRRSPVCYTFIGNFREPGGMFSALVANIAAVGINYNLAKIRTMAGKQ